jgi:hypothetical protein
MLKNTIKIECAWISIGSRKELLGPPFDNLIHFKVPKPTGNASLSHRYIDCGILLSVSEG